MGAFFSFRVTTKNVFPTGKLHTFHRCLDTKVYPDSRLCRLHAVGCFECSANFWPMFSFDSCHSFVSSLLLYSPAKIASRSARFGTYVADYVYLFILQHCSLFINRTYIEEIMYELSTLIFTFKIQLLLVYS